MWHSCQCSTMVPLKGLRWQSWLYRAWQHPSKEESLTTPKSEMLPHPLAHTTGTPPETVLQQHQKELVNAVPHWVPHTSRNFDQGYQWKKIGPAYQDWLHVRRGSELHKSYILVVQSLISPNSGSRIWCKILKNPTNRMPDSCDVISYLASHWSDFSGYCVIS